MIQIWSVASAFVAEIADIAKRAESSGVSGLAVYDAQNTDGEVYVALAAAATATKTLLLGTGVTNPVTRHPAVAAAAMASLQQLSGGRMTLGIGRGDSSLAHIGRAPASVSELSLYVQALQKYLRGESVPFDEISFYGNATSDLSTLGLADGPSASRIDWLARELAHETTTPYLLANKVPVEVSATGPKVIALAAVHADRVMLAVGADPVRIKWAMKVAREARIAVGLDPDAIKFGAWLNIVVHDDIVIARRLAAGGVSLFARFAVMHGKSTGPQTSATEAVMQNLYKDVDMNDHTSSQSRQALALPNEFIEQFGVVGDTAACVAKLKMLEALGIDKVAAVGMPNSLNPADVERANALFFDELVPALVA